MFVRDRKAKLAAAEDVAESNGGIGSSDATLFDQLVHTVACIVALVSMNGIAFAATVSAHTSGRRKKCTKLDKCKTSAYRLPIPKTVGQIFSKMPVEYFAICGL